MTWVTQTRINRIRRHFTWAVKAKSGQGNFALNIVLEYSCELEVILLKSLLTRYGVDEHEAESSEQFFLYRVRPLLCAKLDTPLHPYLKKYKVNLMENEYLN